MKAVNHSGKTLLGPDVAAQRMKIKDENENENDFRLRMTG